MIGAIGSLGVSIRTPCYYSSPLQRSQRDPSVQQQQSRNRLHMTAVRAPQTGAPVNPVDAVRPVRDATFNRSALLDFMQYDPVETAVRSRIQYMGDGEAAAAGAAWGASASGVPSAEGADYAPALPGVENALPGQAAWSIPGLPDAAVGASPGAPGQKEAEEPAIGALETRSAREVMDEAECQTCKNRKYQDGSDDMGVSFQSPTHIDPDAAAGAVRGHENEHVVRDRVKAEMEDRKVVSQSVTYKTAICPECGRVYVSGGQTRTVSVGESQPADPEKDGDSEENKDGQESGVKAAAA